MSLVKLIPIWLHGVAGYAVGLLLLAAPFALGFTGHAAATWVSLVLGAGAIVASFFTNYPLGVVKIIPVAVHALADYAVAVVLIVAALALYGNAPTQSFCARCGSARPMAQGAALMERWVFLRPEGLTSA